MAGSGHNGRMTRGVAALAAVLVIAGCSADEDQPEHVIDEDAWRTSVETWMKDNDLLDLRRLPSNRWEEISDPWRDVCGATEDEFGGFLIDLHDEGVPADFVDLNLRYVCPDNLEVAQRATRILRDIEEAATGDR